MTSGPVSGDATPADSSVVRGASLRTQVKQAIEDLIVFGALAPGEHLVEGALADRLGVSRQPVREALQTLAGSGFIDLQSGRGAFVHRPTPREVREAFHVRALIEADSAAQAAVGIDAEALATLEDLVEAGTAIASDGDSRRLIELNSRFHDTVTAVGGNRVSQRILDDLQRRIAWYLATIITGRAPSSWVEHRQIFEAIRSGDAAAASSLTHAHVHRSLELLDFATS